jgi:AbrB family looped-hinge helix DNA binding protein
MATAMTVKGQVTIPKAVRDAAGIKPGDMVTAEAMPDGGILIRPENEAARLADHRARIEAVSERTGKITRWPGKSTDEVMRVLRGDD